MYTIDAERRKVLEDMAAKAGEAKTKNFTKLVQEFERILKTETDKVADEQLRGLLATGSVAQAIASLACAVQVLVDSDRSKILLLRDEQITVAGDLAKIGLAAITEKLVARLLSEKEPTSENT